LSYDGAGAEAIPAWAHRKPLSGVFLSTRIR